MNQEAEEANKKTTNQKPEEPTNDQTTPLNVKYEIDMDWVAHHLAENPTITKEQIIKWYKQSIEKIKLCGLDVTRGNSVIQTAVVSKIQENITVPPTEFRMMVLGPYPMKIWGGNPSVKLVAFASKDTNPLQITNISAYGDFVGVKNDIEPLGLYKTGFSFFEEDFLADPAMYDLTVQEATEFSKSTKCEGQTASYDEKLKVVQDGVPAVNLGDIGRGLSKLKKSKRGSDYTDTLDLKKITVQVVGTKDGVDKNGRAWGMYYVVDGTFVPTVKVKSLPVWVDSSIHNRLQAGKDSFLEIYGVIEKSKKDDSISMSACFIHPLNIVSNEPEAQTDQPQVTPQIADEYEILVDAGNHSTNMEAAGM